MLFSLTNTPTIFQAYINNILKEYLDKFILVYIDNIFIYSNTFKEYIEHI